MLEIFGELKIMNKLIKSNLKIVIKYFLEWTFNINNVLEIQLSNLN